MKKTMDQKGGVTLEFALLLPVLALFLMGIVEFGFVFYNQQKTEKKEKFVEDEIIEFKTE